MKIKEQHLSIVKFSMFIIAIVILFVTLQRLVIAPFRGKLKKQSSDIVQKKELIKQAKALLSEKEKGFSQDFVKLSRKIQERLPVERKETQFLSEISLVAENTNVHISVMNPRPFKEIGAFKELSVELEMESNLGNLVRFLHQLRESSVVLVTNSIHLEPKSDRSALLKGQIVISTIFLKEP